MRPARERLRLVLALLPFLIAIPAGAAPPPLDAAIDSAVAPFVADQRFAGAALVVRDHTVLFDRAYGLADAAHNIPNTTVTGFHIGALSEQFTAAVVLWLIEKRRLFPGNTADQYLGGADRRTIAQLLETPGDSPARREAYRQLARIAEIAAAKPYADLIDTYVFGPLWLHGAGLDDGTVASPGIAKGYGRDAAGALVPMAANWPGRAGEGSAYMTTRDEASWVNAQFSGDLLPPTAVSSALPPDMGWQHVAGMPALEVTAHGDGFSSAAIRVPATGLTVIVLANVDTPAAAQIARTLAALADGPGH